MSVWNFFDSISYINLGARIDRDMKVNLEFNRVGLKAERIAAETGENKALAFNASQYKALLSSHGSTLILEDDVIFKEGWHLNQALHELPSDWDIVYLGANIIGSDVTGWEMPTAYSKHLRRVTNAWTTHAIAYSESCVDFILSNWNYEEFPIYDEWLRVNVLPIKNCFVVYPMVADQSPGFSDIWQTQVNYGFFDQGNEKMKV